VTVASNSTVKDAGTPKPKRLVKNTLTQEEDSSEEKKSTQYMSAEEEEMAKYEAVQLT
jgi:hypothetical protein